MEIPPGLDEVDPGGTRTYTQAGMHTGNHGSGSWKGGGGDDTRDVGKRETRRDIVTKSQFLPRLKI